MRSAARADLASAVLGCLCLAPALVGCLGGGEETGALGAQGKVRFHAESDLAFTQVLVVGSSFKVTSEAAADDVKLGGAKLKSADDKILKLEDVAATGGTARMVGSGDVELQIEQDGKVLDSVVIKARKPAATALADASLLAVTDKVDARLPREWAVLSGKDVKVAVAAVDGCAGELLDLNASTLETSGLQATVNPGAPANFVLQASEAGELTLTLKTPGLKDLKYTLTVAVRDDVDEVKLAVASAEDAEANLWGRAFVNDVELVGDLEFSWSATERVTLAAATGLANKATIALPAQGDPPDDRPAEATAELFGEEATVDFLTLTDKDLVSARGKPARDVPEPEQTGCGGDGSCAALVLVASSLKGLRRVRRSAHG